MRPPFDKASMDKRSVVKCSYDSWFFKVSIQRLCQSYPHTIGFTYDLISYRKCNKEEEN